MTEQIVRIAFICTGNSARSQMAEGFARAWANEHVVVESAGTNPFGLSRTAVQVMAEAGIDISHHTSKDLSHIDPEPDFVITLCDSADRNCPLLSARRERLHWPIGDPSRFEGSETSLERYRHVRDVLAEKLRAFLAEHHLLKKGPDGPELRIAPLLNRRLSDAPAGGERSERNTGSAPPSCQNRTADPDPEAESSPAGGRWPE